MDEERTFKALADATRRTVLDRLFAQDGQSLQDLCAGLHLSRYGVMKHIGILVDAGLVVQRKSGRFTQHFINPVPIQKIHKRWVSKYSETVAAGLLDFAHRLEEETMKTKTHVYSIQIRAGQSQVWKALVDPDLTRQYYFGTALHTTLRPGDPYEYRDESGQVMISGTILEAESLSRLVMSFVSRWNDEGTPSPPTKVTLELKETNGVCTLTVVHEGLDEQGALRDEIVEGWTTIFSGLKTLLETGSPLVQR